VTLLTWVSAGLVIVGLFFTVVAVVGLVRLPDLYARSHATSKADTLGTVLTLAGVAVAFEAGVPRVKLALLAIFLLITNPTATHAITRAAYDQGIEPETTEDIDPAASGGSEPQTGAEPQADGGVDSRTEPAGDPQADGGIERETGGDSE
jgi:multicomponent Na+:H+ antiporter subunit G